MEKLLLLRKYIEKYTDIPFLRTVFGWLAKAIALVILVMGIIAFIDNWGNMGKGVEPVLAMIILQALYLVFIYLAFHFWWMKGMEILDLKDKDYLLTPVAQRYIKATGETTAAFFILMGVAGMFTMLFTERVAAAKSTFVISPLSIGYISFNVESSFLRSIEILVNGVVQGVVALGVFYLIAELLTIYMDIARNTRKK